jgi:hypothetical protein
MADQFKFQGTYDPSQVSLIVGGTRIIGWESITFADAEARVTPRRSADGQQSRSVKRNVLKTCTIVLNQQSEGVAILDVLALSSEVVPVIFNDGSGIATVATAVADVSQQGDMAFGQEAGDVTYTMNLYNANAIQGGNS